MKTITNKKRHILRSGNHAVFFDGWGGRGQVASVDRITVTSQVDDVVTTGGSMSEFQARGLWKFLHSSGYSSSVLFEDGIESTFMGFMFEF